MKLLERLKTEQSPDSHEPQIEGSKKPVSNFSGNLGMILAKGTLMTHEKKILPVWNLTEHRELYWHLTFNNDTSRNSDLFQQARWMSPFNQESTRK